MILAWYSYCGANPTSRVDASGKEWSIVGQSMAIGAVVGAVGCLAGTFGSTGKLPEWWVVAIAAAMGAAGGYLFGSIEGLASGILGASSKQVGALCLKAAGISGGTGLIGGVFTAIVGNWAKICVFVDQMFWDASDSSDYADWNFRDGGPWKIGG